MKPIIFNIDSPLDLRTEVESAWAGIDFEKIRECLAPHVPPAEWRERQQELGCIGFISRRSLSIAYDSASPYDDKNVEGEDDWPKRDRLPLRGNEDRPREIDARLPRKGNHNSIVEPLGIYVDRLRDWVSSNVTSPTITAEVDAAACADHPAILLCPEAIRDSSDALYRIAQPLRKPFASDNESLSFVVESVVLHELGHHFFPTHRLGGRLYLNEALANLFTYHGLKTGNGNSGARNSVTDRLLYKSLLLQPDPYSAYRPLNAALEIDPHCKLLVGMCFSGKTEQWATLRGKSFRGFARDLGVSRRMGIYFDARVAHRLWFAELGSLIGQNDQWVECEWGGGLHFHARLCTRDATISPDFLADLYERRDLACWLADNNHRDVMSHGWGFGSDSNSYGGHWPESCIDFNNAANVDVLVGIITDENYEVLVRDRIAHNYWLRDDASNIFRCRVASAIVKFANQARSAFTDVPIHRHDVIHFLLGAIDASASDHPIRQAFSNEIKHLKDNVNDIMAEMGRPLESYPPYFAGTIGSYSLLCPACLSRTIKFSN